MTVKKWNARLSLLTLLLLLIHEGYHLYAYITMYYNPVLSKVTGYALAASLALHAILSIVIVFGMHDSKKIAYKKRNLRTVLQRISGCMIIVLLPIHIFSFGLLQSSVGGIGFVLTELAQILFYGALFCHFSTSFSNALVTLGWLSNRKKKRVIDIIVTTVSVLLFLAASVIITMTHTMIFNGQAVT